MWKELLTRCVLACAIVHLGICFVQTDTRFHTINNVTSGDPGEGCEMNGKRKCLRGAPCVNGKCECPDGLKGKAQFECVEQEDYLCTIVGDPHIHSFSNARGSVNMPCRFRAARYTTDLENSNPLDSGCFFEIFVTNVLNKGFYRVSSVHSVLGVNDNSKQARKDLHVYKTADYEMEDKEIYSFLTNSTVHETQLGTGHLEKLDWMTILPTFDVANNFAMLYVPICHSRIKFRAFKKYGPAFQELLPGFSVQAPGDARFHTDFGNFPASVCGRPSDGSTVYQDFADNLGLSSDDTAIIYAVLDQAVHQEDNEHGEKCNLSFELFENSTAKVADLNACQQILNKHKTRKCIEKDGREPLEYFNCCLAYQQGAFLSDCDTIKTAVGHCYQY